MSRCLAAALICLVPAVSAAQSRPIDHDAIRATGATVIEVHLSNVFARESFRHHSYISPVAKGVICGFGAASYELAFDALISHLA